MFPPTQKHGNPMSIPVVLVTGHPATGKTTLASVLAKALRLPLIAKDAIKETLFVALDGSGAIPSNKVAVATWDLLYQQVEALVGAGVPLIVEGNFDPRFANAQWQKFSRQFSLRIIQIRCECEPDVLLARYRHRIERGVRHPGHVNQSDDPNFHRLIRSGPLDWVDVPSERIVVNTTLIKIEDYTQVVAQVQEIMGGTKPRL